MTWYANNVYARRSEMLEDALCKEFSGSVYRVNDLRTHSWWKPEIIHGVPEEGLLAVRPFASSDESDHLHDWYEEPVVSWDNFSSFEDSGLELLIPPKILGEANEDGEAYPPEGFLRFLRYLAKKRATAICYYQSFMWGGDIESEFAFVYSGNDEFFYLFVGFEDQKPQIEIRKNSMAPTRKTGEVLVHALRHIGLDLPSFYFALHTRGFDWSRHHLKHTA